ncbi:ATP-binding cassette sub-family A member 2 [Caerostris extrusa]|uniref:ATP-binding cassette sub-family A member 2 n=1 Tax=Caerostris extrusa TaxID=172846 RepID=A0AAV4WYA2_CAEEX|nr:ATP-binding cassette sub-family A member 2 [Caerostris extrusa]
MSTFSDSSPKQTNSSGFYDSVSPVPEENSPVHELNDISLSEVSSSEPANGSIFTTILLKRFYCTKRNWKGIFSQILLPAFFVSIAMSVALTAPKVEDLPPLVLSPSQYYNYTQPQGNIIPYSSNKLDVEDVEDRWSKDANSGQVSDTLYMPSGVGATCVFKSPFNNSFDENQFFCS